MTNRRKVLIGLGGAIAIAGCAENADGEDEEEEPEPSDGDDFEPTGPCNQEDLLHTNGREIDAGDTIELSIDLGREDELFIQAEEVSGARPKVELFDSEDNNLLDVGPSEEIQRLYAVDKEDTFHIKFENEAWITSGEWNLRVTHRTANCDNATSVELSEKYPLTGEPVNDEDEDDEPDDEDGEDEGKDDEPENENGEDEGKDDEPEDEDGEDEGKDDEPEDENGEDEDEDELQPAEFQFSAIEPGEESIVQGESIELSATLENVGGKVGIVEIEVMINGELKETQSVTLEGGEQTTVGYHFNSSDFEIQEYDYSFETENDQMSATLSILESATFEFTDSTPDGDTAEYGELVDIAASIKNTGDVIGSETIEFEFNGEEIDTLDISLDPNEETSVVITIDTGQYEEGEKFYSFTAESDDITGSITIQLEEPAIQTFSGNGSTVEDGIEIEGGLTVVSATHSGDANFQVLLVPEDGFDKIFVNEIGDFDGAQADLVDEGTYLMDVEADGNWSIDILQPRSTSGDSLPQSLSGSGSDVKGPIEFDGTHIADGTHSGESNFQVIIYPMEGIFGEIVFNEIGDFDGATTFSHDGIGWVDIVADGDWTVGFEV